MLKICANAICKNEKNHLIQFYDALKNEVDYITVLDTGSTDGTWEALQELARKDSKVLVDQKIITPWAFDAARNEAMKLIPKDADVWISIDLDERFEEGFAQTIRDTWKDETLQMTYKYIWSHKEDGSPDHTFTYSKIIANDGKWVWKYPIHECLKRTEDVQYSASQIVDNLNKITLHHWQDRNISRKYYLDLLKVRWEKYGEDIDCLYYARELLFHKRYEESSEVFGVLVQKGGGNLSTSMEKAYVHYMKGVCRYFLKDTDGAEDLFRKAIQIDPSFRDPYIDYAKLLIEKSYYAEAANLLRGCLKLTYRHFSWVEVNPVWEEVPMDLLSVCLCNSGEKLEAIAVCAYACKLCPSNENLKKNLDILVDSLKESDFAR